MKLFTAAQIRAWDKFTINEEQIPPVELMERAATTCFKWIKKNISITKHMVICCGSGNNGGDGLVIARLLSEAKFTVSIYILNNKKTSAEFAINLDKLLTSKVDLFYDKLDIVRAYYSPSGSSEFAERLKYLQTTSAQLKYSNANKKRHIDNSKNCFLY